MTRLRFDRAIQNAPLAIDFDDERRKVIEKDDRPGVPQSVELLLHRLNCIFAGEHPAAIQQQPDYGRVPFVQQAPHCGRHLLGWKRNQVR